MIPKFRVYNFENGEMLSANDHKILSDDYEFLSELFMALNADDSMFSEPMQSTGLLDKNDREIFEGDLLRDSESIVIVKFKDGEFIVDYRNMVGEWRNYGSLFSYLKDFEGEVIGDIYQNPELLEVEDDTKV